MTEQPNNAALEESLRESERLNASLLEMFPNPVIIATAEEGRFLEVNDRFCEVTGYSRTESVGKTASELQLYVNPADRSRMIEILRRERLVNDFETRLKGNGNILFQCHISIKPTYYKRQKCLLVVTGSISALTKAQKALRQSENRFQTLLDSITECYYEVDLGGNFTYFNNAVTSLLGYSREELLGMSYREYTSEEEARKLYEIFNDVYRNETQVTFVEYAIRRKDNSIIMVETSASLLKNSEGRSVGFYGILRDRTKQKKAEEVLRESEESYRSLMELAPDAITVSKMSDSRYIEVNDAFCRLSGYCAQEAVGRTALELNLYADPKDRNRLRKAVKKEGQVENMEILFKEKSGALIDTLVSARLITFRGTECLLVIVTNITTLKQAQEALRRSEEKHRTILEEMEEGYYETDLRGNLTKFNQSTLKLHGYAPEELMGMSYTKYLQPEQCEENRRVFKNIYESGEPVKILDYEIIRPDGSVRLIELSAYPLKNSNGETIGFWGITRDRTEQKRIEAQLMQARKMEAVGTLAGGIAHDFNNLLMGIQGNNAVAMMEVDDDHPMQEQLKSIESYVRAGANLTRQLLGAAMGGKYEVKPTYLNEVVDNSASLFGRTKKEITIERKLQEELWAVDTDRGQIEQVLLNLYVNAAHAMPQGGRLLLETENVTLDDYFVKPYNAKPGRYVKLSVSDSGIGIDPKNLKRIFDPFFTTKEMGRGTGLGLASVYGIISNHGGIITVYSELGIGTTFKIFLPATDKPVELPQETKLDIVTGKETILFVDDEEGIVEVGALILSKLGYQVITAGSGQEAIEIYRLRMNQIDLVILDMIMPEMSGSETFCELKKINPAIRALLSSGYSINGQAKDILEHGCKGFIQKPFGMQDLSAKVRSVLDDRELEVCN